MNNAGLSRGLDKLYTGKVEDWDEMIDTNVKGLLYVTRAVVPGMVVRGHGHIVNLGSTAGEITYPNGAVYCASKAAERAINDGLRQDVLGTPVRVTSIDPGMVETDFSLVRFHGDEERAAKVYKGVTPLTPEDIADAIVWAVSRPAHVNIARVHATIDQANSLISSAERRCCVITGMLTFNSSIRSALRSAPARPQGRPPRRVRSPLRQNVFPLQIERLLLPFLCHAHIFGRPSLVFAHKSVRVHCPPVRTAA